MGKLGCEYKQDNLDDRMIDVKMVPSRKRAKESLHCSSQEDSTSSKKRARPTQPAAVKGSSLDKKPVPPTSGPKPAVRSRTQRLAAGMPPKKSAAVKKGHINVGGEYMSIKDFDQWSNDFCNAAVEVLHVEPPKKRRRKRPPTEKELVMADINDYLKNNFVGARPKDFRRSQLKNKSANQLKELYKRAKVMFPSN